MMPAHAGTGSTTSDGATQAQLRARVQTAKDHFKKKATSAPRAATKGTPTTEGEATTGTVTPRIIGGSTTTFSAAPWMVQLWYYNAADDTSSFCGGTLVAPNKVLTAGHCVAGMDWIANGTVVGGSATFGGTDTDTYSYVRRQAVHWAYNDQTVDNDIAVLTLSTPMTYGTLPLATDTDTALYQAGGTGTVYGWGVTDSAPDSQSFPDQLQHLDMPLNSDTACKDNLDAAVGAGSFVVGHMICAGIGGTDDDTTGKTTCSGDSGGPLVVGGRIVGIVSWGVGTASQSCNVSGTYDVFTKVSAYGGYSQPRINDTDMSRDGKGDVLGKLSTGASYQFTSMGNSFKARVAAPISFANYNSVVQADLERDGYQDYVLRATSSGNVFMGHRTPTRSSYSYIQIGSNWKTRRAILVPGDLTGDGKPDLLSETSDGRVWIYSGKGNGLFNQPVAAGSGWTKYNLVVGHGDFSNDGKADVFAREASTGNLYLLQGTGNASAPFAAPVLVRTGWNGYNAVIAVGDVSGDGRADLLARTPSGALFLHKGTGATTSSTFAAAVNTGTGWGAYSLLG
ncbi:trypsin-like serine protease [Streptomyces sp.]|uniref:trypsin-like serine protease n=1 Tax=Streptomyces sp. TaxID=1931 RepID=UPI002F40615B